MQFEVCGPFTLPRTNGAVDRSAQAKREFWDTVDSVKPGLPDACGCYLFCMRGVVRYIGKAERQSFRQECLQLHKLLIYNEVLREITGQPSIILVPKLTPKRRLASPSVNQHKDIQVLENILIGLGIAKNSNLKNISGTVALRRMQVPGILNSKAGQAKAASVKYLKKALGV